MSEPVSKAEIEDVLSSIRRLVSENSSSIRREPADEQGPDKLVLTPAFRVDETEQSEAPEAEADAVVEAEVEARADTFAEAPEPDLPAADDTAADWPSAPDAPEERDSDPEPDDALVSITPAGQDAETETETDADVARVLSPLEQRIAELEAIVARSAAEFEPDGSEDDALPETFVFHHHVLDPGDTPEGAAEAAEADSEQADEAAFAPAPEAAAEEAQAAEEAEADVQQPEEAAFATVAEGDAVMPVEAEAEDFGAEAAEIDIEAEPDMPAIAAVAAGGFATEQDSETDLQAEPAPEEMPRETEPFAGAPDSDAWEDIAEPDDDGDGEAFIDEEALREMVARMVREELQGTIGERITHNVRRMVRREIARALSLQEFD